MRDTYIDRMRFEWNVQNCDYTWKLKSSSIHGSLYPQWSGNSCFNQTITVCYHMKQLYLLLYNHTHATCTYVMQKAATGVRVFIIGAGPVGLRLAIDCILLGAEVVVVDKRKTFSRNNVLHVWPFTIEDLRQLGAKKFYGKFCAGAIDHISESQGCSTLALHVCMCVHAKGFT